MPPGRPTSGGEMAMHRSLLHSLLVLSSVRKPACPFWEWSEGALDTFVLLFATDSRLISVARQLGK
jgi:hypothetical protein